MTTVNTTAYRSPNHHARTQAIDSIILHTCEGTRAGSIGWLCTPASQVSAHYYVCRNGDLFQLVDDSRCAWHAGVVEHNERGIGIECEHKQGQDWPVVQREALSWLVRKLITAYDIPLRRVLAHRWIAPGRKIDPTDWPDDALRSWIAQQYDAPPVAPSPADDRAIIATPATMSLEHWIDVMRRRSPITDGGELTTLYLVMTQWEIDPAGFLAMWLVEQGPTMRGELSATTRNPLNVAAYGRDRWPAIQYKDRWWNVYESWQLGAHANLLHLKQKYGAVGLLTVRQIVPVFAPSSDGNDVDRYIRSVMARMAEVAG